MTEQKKEPKVNDLFLDYLKIAGLDQVSVSATQKSEARRAFYAGSGAMLTVLVEYVQNQPDEAAAVAVVKNLIEQVQMFFVAEIATKEAPPKPAPNLILPPALKILR